MVIALSDSYGMSRRVQDWFAPPFSVGPAASIIRGTDATIPNISRLVGFVISLTCLSEFV